MRAFSVISSFNFFSEEKSSLPYVACYSALGEVLKCSLFSGHISAAVSTKHSSKNFPTRKQLTFNDDFWRWDVTCENKPIASLGVQFF